jgi:cephalosporin hydroxylase
VLYRHTGFRLSGRVFRSAVRDVLSEAKHGAMPGARRREREAVSSARTPADWFELSRAQFGVGPEQQPEEILGLIELAAANRTRAACEIGVQDAGTSVLLSRVIPGLDTLVLMDLFIKNRRRLRRAASTGQAVHTIDGDSAHPLTVERLRRKLGSRSLDLLVIDGDHRFAGVRQDFLNYRQFVRDGGLIAFHDILPVRSPDSPHWAGDVPAFWALVAPLYPSRELVADRGQDGFGIGVVEYDAGAPVEPILRDSAENG